MSARKPGSPLRPLIATAQRLPVVQPERELLLERQGVEPTRRGKCPLDRVVRDPRGSAHRRTRFFHRRGQIGGYPLGSLRESGHASALLGQSGCLSFPFRAGNQDIVAPRVLTS